MKTLNILKTVSHTLCLVLILLFLSGCFGSLPKKETPDFLKNVSTKKTQPRPENDAIAKRMAEQMFPGSTNQPREILCHDRATKGNYSEDESPDCIRAQTLKAYKAFNLQMDPEVPYCILRQESSSVKNNADPYDVAFDRFATCGGNGKKYCGIGLAQFTFGTWNGYGDILASAPDDRAKLQACLNDLSTSSNLQHIYNNVSVQEVGKSTVDDKKMEAKTQQPTEMLNPFYRDQAICMNALHISQMRAADASNRGSYAVVGKGKKRRRVYLDPSLAQATKIGSTYNGGGTKGYGSAIGQCVNGFRKYDNEMQASADTFHLRNTRAPANTIVERESQYEPLFDKNGNSL